MRSILRAAGILMALLVLHPAHAKCRAPAPAMKAGTQQIVYSERTYVVSVPQPCLRSHCGLIVDVHGTSMTPDSQDGVTHLRRLAADAVALGAPTPYIVVQPRAPGVPSHWSNDDADTLFQDVSCLADALSVDARRTHLGGYSLGAYLVARIACDHPGAFASYGLIAGGADTFASCMRQAGPALYIHGIDDDVIPFVTAQRLADVARNQAADGGRIEELGSGRTRYVSGDLWLETAFHSNRSPMLGAHCVPGGSGPIGCVSPSFDSGTEMLKFYISHERG